MHLHKSFFTSSSTGTCRRYFPLVFSKFGFHRGIMKHCNDSGIKRKPFSLIHPRSTDSMWTIEKPLEMQKRVRCETFEYQPGILLLRGYLDISTQVEIVNKCEELAVGQGGLYDPYPGRSKFRRKLMCLGRNWDPQKKYNERFRSDGSEVPPIPYLFARLVESALNASQFLFSNMHLSKYEVPSMSPDICLVNFYTNTANLDLHQDCDESSYSLRTGLPVVSFSIGDSTIFYCSRTYTTNPNGLEYIRLESGDVLVFGGKSRLIYHGVNYPYPNTAPLELLKETMLRPGRLNLTFREF